MKRTLLVSAGLLLAAACAQAQDKATLDLLVKKGLISQAEADGLMKTKETAPVVVTAKDTNAKKLTVGAIAQVRYSYISANEKKGAADPADASGFMARRVMLLFGAELGGGFSVAASPEFDTTRNAAQQSYLNFAFIRHTSEYGTADLGFRKTNFGIEEYVSPTSVDNPVVEYSAATWRLASNFASRHLGLYWDGKVKDTGFRYGAAFTNSQQDLWNTGGASPAGGVGTAATSGSNNEPALWANVAYDFAVPDSDAKATIGLNTGRVGDTGTTASDIVGYNPFVKFTMGNLSLCGEFLGWIANGRNGAVDANPWGYNLTAAYKVTESIEPVLRFSRFNGDGLRTTTQGVVLGAPATSSTYDDVTAIYAGFNWYLVGKSVKLQTGYEFTQLTDAANGASQVDAHAVRSQVQVVF